MRIGVHLGPFYASTSTRRRRRSRSTSNASAYKFIFAVIVIGWPLELGQRSGGGWHGWVWAIAIPWWALLLLLWIASKSGRSKSPAPGKASSAAPPAARPDKEDGASPKQR